ncbi:unnamed protein product [Didymodactylos carnosus]|uniref:Pentatricopeptide repeat-containing protein-mitochondrial domain-containing protein n=1 Tax=Didymodactylos carnosus TaxID=1234261 RepID=A0A8S2DBU9_9BILA|nr:unnamed protein product [Didymodactylos carnosus]CAF3638859.1 unnamed protein product [Didymodactylos carnosus]
MSERLSLLLLNAAARSVHNVSSQKRIKLLEEAWSALKKNNVRLTSRHYETYLSGLNENGHIFDPDYYLKLIDSQQIQATPKIYSLLLTQFCREGNTDRAQNFLKMLKEKNISVDEDIFAALCVCQLKRGNDNGAQEIVQIMNERGLKSTISTYKEIFICLISEHRLEQFQSYYQQIEDQHERQSQSIVNDENKELQQTNKHGSSSSVYLDAKFVLSLLNQCILYKERPIFDYLFEKLKRMNHANIPHNILNLSIQCLSNNWHKSAIELLQLQSDVEAPQDDLPYMPINDRIWVLFFKRVFETHEPKMIDLYMKLMMQKSLKPLDTILFAYYQTNASKNMDFRQAITFLLSGEELQHPMRTNYFYPLMLDSYYRNKDKWTDAERLQLFSLIDRQQIPIEGTTYSYHIKEHFHSFYNNDFKHLLTTLNNNNLEYILNKLCRFLINDIQQSMKQLHVLEQVAPFFKLNIQARREEFARVIYQLLQTKPKLLPFESTSVESSPPSSAITTSDTTLSPIFSSINTICEQLSDNLTLKRDLYALLLQLATQDSRDDLCSLIANECIKNNVKFGGNVNEIDSMTRYTLPRDILEQLTRYKQGEKTWKQKLNSLNLETVTQEELEQIYAEAKQDGRHPLLIQEQLIDIYTARSHIHEAFAILNEIVSTKYVPSEKVLKQLFHLITNKMVSQSVQVKPKIYLDYLKLLCDLYERHFGIDHLTPNLTFRIAHTFMLANDEENALKIIKNKLSMSGMDNELFEHVIKFLKVDKSWLSTDALKSIGQHFLQYRVSDELTIFWNLYYDIMLEKSTTKDLVKFYSESVQHNSNLPYTYLFEKPELPATKSFLHTTRSYKTNFSGQNETSSIPPQQSWAPAPEPSPFINGAGAGWEALSSEPEPVCE